MDGGGYDSPEKRQRRLVLVVGAVAGLLLVIIVVATVLGLTLQPKTHTFKTTFITKCEQFKGYDCEKLWGAFQKAYVGRDPCRVPMEAYNPLIDAADFKPACNRMMFWSKTKDVVHEFTQKKGCYVTLEDTVLGFVLDGLTWCGKEGSNETFTTDCPGWSDCMNNSVRSFWNSASAAFADVACGNVSAMLNGSITTPFSPTSIFASIEVKGFHFPRVESLNVVLVTPKNTVANCTNDSLKALQNELDKGIKYSCKEVSEARIQECISNPKIPCGACW